MRSDFFCSDYHSYLLFFIYENINIIWIAYEASYWVVGLDLEAVVGVVHLLL